MGDHCDRAPPSSPRGTVAGAAGGTLGSGPVVRPRRVRPLANASHLRLLQQGVRALESWRAGNPGVPLDLQGAELAGARLGGADLGGCNLADADLSDADLSGATLLGSNLVRAKLTGANLAGALLRKADLRKADLADANLAGADLQGVDAGGANFAKGNLGAANLSNSTLGGAKFGNGNLGATVLKGSDLGDADFAGANLQDADLHKSNLVGATFAGADLTGANLQKAALRDGDRRADLRGARLHRVDFRGCDLSGHDLADADLRDTRLDGVSLAGATLRGADLGGAQMEEADVSGCDFVGVRFDSQTLLRRAKVKGARIDRHTLESLSNYGGLTPGDRMQMKILDGVTLLRSHYSGFWQYIHLFALLLFAYPYAWFVFSQYALAETGFRDLSEEVVTKAARTEEALRKNPIVGRGMKADEPVFANQPPKQRTEIPLWKAFARFIWNGGRDWESGFHLDPVFFAIFLFSLSYNLLRFVMVFKTAELTLTQEASGLPIPVSALGVWGRLVHIMEVGFCINVVLVLFHTFHFLQKPVVMYVAK